MAIIYLDNNATTKIDPIVVNALIPYMNELYGNASSTQHYMGREANLAIETARITIAKHLNVSDQEVYFTSGATEAINTVLKGVFEKYQSIGKHIITAQTEHKATLSVCHELEKKGAEITYLSVDENGQINLQNLRNAIRPDTILVSLMAANNETGVIHPIDDIALLCQEKNVLFFCDATQYIGKACLDLRETPIDILCFSGHKLHAPKGIGVLFIRRKSKTTQVAPLLVGGNQENGFRAGTYPVHQIVGIGKAVEIITQNTDIEELRNYLEESIISRIPETKILCKNQPRLKNTSNILFKHIRSSDLMVHLPRLAVSSGSACVTGDRDPSHVLLAMGYAHEDAQSCLRFSLSKFTTKDEITETIDMLVETCEKLRSQSPIWQMHINGLLD